MVALLVDHYIRYSPWTNAATIMRQRGENVFPSTASAPSKSPFSLKKTSRHVLRRDADKVEDSHGHYLVSHQEISKDRIGSCASSPSCQRHHDIQLPVVSSRECPSFSGRRRVKTVKRESA